VNIVYMADCAYRQIG